MCAIFGLGFLNGHVMKDNNIIRNIVRGLFLESMARGRTASGLAYVSPNNIKVIKSDLAAKTFINIPEYDMAEKNYMNFSNKYKPVSILGHCRLKTKGSELHNANNHPIVREDVVGTHNGMISNDDFLFDNYSDHFKRNAEVDSEIIFALIEHFSKKVPTHEAISKTATSLAGSFACSMVHKKQPYTIWLFRRYTPCSVIIFKDVGLLVWSTNNLFIRNVLSTNEAFCGEGEEVEFNRNSGLGIDLYRNKIYRFNLGEYKYFNECLTGYKNGVYRY